MNKTPAIPAWYQPLADRLSLGQTTHKATSLAGLHQARLEHEGQFWTPSELAALIWRLLAPALAPKSLLSRHITILDNSIGSGRMVQFADPSVHAVTGFDPDEGAILALASAMGAAGFSLDITAGRMQDKRVSGFDVAIINPPYSLQLEAASLEPFPCTVHGRFGPNSSAKSHAYALDQALFAAQVVAAVLPSSYAETLAEGHHAAGRLRLLARLPSSTFASEGASVDTTLAVYGPSEGKPLHNCRLVSLQDRCDLDLSDFEQPRRASASCKAVHFDLSSPVITRAVTGDPTVRVTRSRHRIKLAFQCGFTEARVLNAVHRERLAWSDTHRYPHGVKTAGQGQLDLEIHLVQPDPLQSLANLFELIRASGGVPAVDPALLHYARKRIRALAITNTPLRLYTFVQKGDVIPTANPQSGVLSAVCRKKHLLNPTRWGSPLVKVGEAMQIEVIQSEDQPLYRYAKGTETCVATRPEILDRFDISSAESAANDDQWLERFPGRAVSFPNKAAAITARAKAFGLDQICSWAYQFQDLIELSMTRGGVVAAHMMGLGKSRIAASLCLLGGGRHNLIVCEAQAVPEFENQLREMGIPADQWQTIESPAQARHLKTFNLISYTRLRLPLAPGARRNYASVLRNRIHTAVADEGHLLSNLDTDQVKALYQVAPKRRYAATGTPMGNLPRQAFALIAWATSDGTAEQPYGRRRPFIEPRLINSMAFCERGQDRIKDQFVIVEWCTSEWEEDHTTGGKREIPSLRNLDLYRQHISKYILRRVWGEPEVAPYVQVPDPTTETITLPWAPAHMAAYLRSAEDFASWWKQQRASGSAAALNMVAALARINAVMRAANFPGEIAPEFAYHGPTTKTERLVADLIQNERDGRTTIFFALSPTFLANIQRRLAAAGVQSVLYTGKQTIRARTKALNELFRTGKVKTLLMSFGVGQTALNLPMANEVMFAHRMWTNRQEQQALFRALRPQQKDVVRFRTYHLEGSIDEYMAQMVAFKKDCQSAGLDWATPEHSPDDFKHWLSILDSFVTSLAEMRGVNRFQMREILKAA